MTTTFIKIVDPDNGAGTHYTSLAGWEDAFGGTTDGDLVTNDEIAIAQCRNSAGSADTAAVDVSGWETSITNYLRIEPYTGYGHNGVYDETKYYLHNNDSVIVMLAVEEVAYITGIQIKVTATGINNRGAAYLYSGVKHTFGNNIIKGIISSTGICWGVNSDDYGYIYNNVVYGFINGVNTNKHGIRLNTPNVMVSNNTVYGCYYGIKIDAGDVTSVIKNNIVFSCTDDIYDASELGTIDYNATDDGDGTHAVAPSGGNWANEMPNYATDDFTLIAGGNCADGGIDDPSGLNYGDPDIVGIVRSSPWDIGAFEVAIISSTITTIIDSILSYSLTKSMYVDSMLQALSLKTASLDSMLQILNLKTVGLDSVLQVLNLKTASLDSILQALNLKTASLDSILEALNLKTASLDSILEALNLKTASLDSILKALNLETVSLDSILTYFNLKTTSLDSILQTLKYVIGNRVVSINNPYWANGSTIFLQSFGTQPTILWATGSSYSVHDYIEQYSHKIDSILQALNLKTTSLDSILQALNLKTTSLDSILQALNLKTTSLDSILQALNLKTTSLDSILQALNLKTTSLDSILQALNLKTTSLDSILSKVGFSTTDIDAILIESIITNLVTTSLDSILQQYGILSTMSIDSVLQKYRLVVVSVDSILLKEDYSTTLINAILQNEGVITYTTLNAILLAVQSTLTSVDSILLRQAYNNAYLDSILKAGMTGTVFIDSMLLYARSLSNNIDSILQNIDVTSTVNIDSLLKSLVTLNAFIDASLFDPNIISRYRFKVGASDRDFSTSGNTRTFKGSSRITTFN